MTIRCSGVAEMVSIVCELTKKGFGFEVIESNSCWVITLTGGF